MNTSMHCDADVSWPHAGAPGLPSFSDRDEAHILHDRLTGALVQRRWSGKKRHWLMETSSPEDCAARFSYVSVVLSVELQGWLQMSGRETYTQLTVDAVAADGVKFYKTAESLLWGVVASARPTSRRARGSIVEDRICCGSTVASLLCRQFGFDPNEKKLRK